MIWIEGLEIPLPGRSGLIFASHNLTTAFYFAQFTSSSHKHAASFKVGIYTRLSRGILRSTYYNSESVPS